MTSVPPSIQIDARDLLCPLPVLRLRKHLMQLDAGSEAVLITTDPAAIIDVPHFCHEAGHTYLGTDTLPDGAAAHRVRKQAQSPTAQNSS